MSEPTGVFSKPESQTVGKCADLREDMQKKLYEKMDKQHGRQMDTLGEIKQEIAYRKGQEDARIKSIVTETNGKKEFNWKQFFSNAIITWGPPFLFIVIWGFISWLKSKGIL